MKRKILSIIICIALLASCLATFSTSIAAKTPYSEGAPYLEVNILHPDGTTTLVYKYMGIYAGEYTAYDSEVGHDVTYHYYTYPELETLTAQLASQTGVEYYYYSSIDALPAGVGTKAQGVTIDALVADANSRNEPGAEDIEWQSGQKMVIYPTDSSSPYQSSDFFTYDFVQGQDRYYYPNLVEKFTAYWANGEDTSLLSGWDADPVPVAPVLCISSFQERYTTDAMLKATEEGEYTFKPNDNEADWRTITTPLTLDTKESIRFCMGLTTEEAYMGVLPPTGPQRYSSTNKFCRWTLRLDFGPVNGPALWADTTANVQGQPIVLTYADDEAWRNAVTGVTVDDIAVDAEHYSLATGTLTLDSSVFSTNGSHMVVVSAEGFMNAKVTQKIGVPPDLRADSSLAVVGQSVDITFSDSSSWRNAVTGVYINGDAVTDYTLNSGKLTIPAADFTLAGDYDIAVKADGYDDTSVTQTLNALLTYSAGEHGDISGVSPQTVSAGGDGTAVTAVADSGYHFVKWSDESTENPRTDTAVTTSISVTADFAPDSFTVSFDSQDGTSVDSQTVDYGGLVTEPANPSKANCSFGGWYRNAEATFAWNFETDTVSGDTTLYAKWIQGEITYAVTFLSDGAVYDTVVTEPDTAIDKPADPTRNGYKFADWYLDEGFTNPVSFPYTASGDTTLYAKWDCDYTYTITGDTAIITGYTGYTGDGGEVAIPGIFTSGGTDYTVTAIADGTSGSYVFIDVKATLTSVTIPDSLTSIGAYAFYQCSSLTSISMGDNVTSIGARAFYKAGLTGLVLPCNASLGDYAFYQCTGLKNLNIPAGVTMGKSVFSGCSGLTTLTLEDGLTSIAEAAFNSCSGITSVTIPNSVTVIDKNAFNSSGLESLNIPSSVTEIGNTAFKGCTGLATVTLPNGLLTIGTGAFRDCSSLGSIVIPDSVTSLGTDVFNGCSALTAVTLSNGLTTIESTSFKNCTVLTTIEIPAGVVAVNANAFNGCNSLNSAYFPGAQPTFGSAVFTGTDSGFIVYYHVSQSDSWSTFTAYPSAAYCVLTLDGNYSGSATASVNSSLDSSGHIVAPDGLTRVGYAFRDWYKEAGCTNIFDFATETVTADLTLYAKWGTPEITHSIPEGHGTAEADITNLSSDGYCLVTFTPDTGYHVAGLTDNEVDVIGSVTDNTYTLTDVTEDHNLVITFAPDVTVLVEISEAAAYDSDFSAGIIIDSVKNFNAADYVVSFDPALLRLDGIDNGEINGTVVPVYFDADLAGAAADGNLILVNDMNMAATGISGSGSLAILHFHVLGNAGQNFEITLGRGTLACNTAEQIPAAWINAAADFSKSDQSINFSVPGNKGRYAADFTIVAEASSELDLTFTATGSCTIDGNTVHITGIGECTITAHQSGNDNYNAAQDVSRTFLVRPAGDVNDDGLINAVDITATIRIILELDQPNDFDNANEDGLVNALDIAEIEQIILNAQPE